MNKNRLRILFDLEATCWEDKEFQKVNFEIIEIGAVKFDCKSFDVIDEFQTFVKPVRNTVLSNYCKNLTSITQEQVDNAPTFDVVYRLFMNWAKDCPLFLGWGNADWDELNNNCKFWSTEENKLECFP